MALSGLTRLPVQTLPNGAGYPSQSAGAKDAAAGYRREPGPTPAPAALPRVDSSADANTGESGSALTLLEAALEAWADCKPDGYTLPEDCVRLVLPAVACRVPGSWQSAGTAHMLSELFTPGVVKDGAGEPEAAVFERMLKAHNGQVHFLYFWSAFSKAARLLASYGSGPDSDLLMAGGDEGLTLELETLRDSILRSIEAEDAAASPSSSSRSKAKPAERSMSAVELIEAVQGTASMSSSPDFWRAAERTLTENKTSDRLSMEDLTVVILSWLREAIAWQPPAASQPVAAAVPEPPKEAETGELPVYLHIYDVSQEDSIVKLNGWLASKDSLLKFGGIFHAGVEVNGLEWSFGMSMCETMPGISCVEPRTHPAHHYRQTVQLRNSKFSAEEIADLISQLIEDYPGDDYDLLRRNCCHFADDMCRRLGAGRIPGWIHRLARVGARLDGAMLAITGRKLINLDEEDSD